ncbi:hypothetical protein HY479_02870 [Candidatus Uhrbacteria bacterium]|nr:hypothetical protein [Candidatus Uhrbacteria bacterium]
MTSAFTQAKPAGSNVEPLSWLEAAGYIKPISPGCIALLPFGTLVLERLTEKLREFAREKGFWELALPLLQRREIWEESGRHERYRHFLAETVLADGHNYVINPTQEEAVLDLMRRICIRPARLPQRLFQIGERIRNEIRPAHGLLRGRSFILADFYAIAADAASMNREADMLEATLLHLMDWCGLSVERGIYATTPLGVPACSFWIKTCTRQCDVHRCTICGRSYRFTRSVSESCPGCGGPLEDISAAEIGDVVRTGTVLAERMGVATGTPRAFVQVAVAGIGLSRLIQFLAERYSDADGLAWPFHLAPLHVHVIPTVDRSVEAQELGERLSAEGFRVYAENRNQSFGRIFVDADMIGLPVRVVLGRRTMTGTFDVRLRRSREEFTAGYSQLCERMRQLSKKEVL